MPDAKKNFAYSTVATAPSPATSGTTLIVATSTGTLFPAAPFNATVWPAGVQPTTVNAEIVRVTAISGDTFTISRQQESTSARSINIGDQIQAGPTVLTFTNYETDLAATQTQNAILATRFEAVARRNANYYVMSGQDGTITGSAAGASGTRVSLAAGRIYQGSTELNISALANQAALSTAQNTTVTSGSNDVAVNTFAGSGTLNVTSTTGFPASGTLFIGDVSSPTVAAVVTYTGGGGGGTTFTGCTFINSGQSSNFTMTTSDTVYGANCDTTYPRWGVIELTNTGTYSLNLGTAAAVPSIPTLNTARIPHYLVYIPANSILIDTVNDTVNGNAKLIDIREVVTARPARLWASDITSPSVSNPHTGLTLLGSQYGIPANSLVVGDVFKVSASLIYTNTTNATTLEIWLGIVGTTAVLIDWTSGTLNANANSRRIDLDLSMQMSTIGASAGFLSAGHVLVGAGSASAFSAMTFGALDNGSGTVAAIGQAGQFASTSDASLALYVDIGASSTCTIALRHFTVTKFPFA